MTFLCFKVIGYVFGTLVFLGSWGITLWIGIAMLVPQQPFKQRDIPTGVCLIVFSWIISAIVGTIAYFTGFVVCLPCSYCIDKYTDDMV